MATLFPLSASVGQQFQDYAFDGETWNIIGENWKPFTYSATEPDYHEPGFIWVDSNEVVEEISYVSASGYQILTNKVMDGDNNYFSNIPESATLPSQYGNTGKYLTTSGSVSSWGTLDLAGAINTASAAAVAAIVDSAPATLDTLNELAAALGDDANYASTITTALGNKLDASSASTTYATKASPTFTGTVVIPTLDLTNPLNPQDGGTGLNSLGSAGYVLKVNSGANALEWGAIAGAVYQASAPTSPQNGDIWIDSDASSAIINTNDFVLKSEAEAYSPHAFLMMGA